MKKGTEYLSPQSRNELAGELKALRKERDDTRARAHEAENRKILDILYKYFRASGHSVSLREKADSLNRSAHYMLRRAETKNTFGNDFSVRDRVELENLLDDRKRFLEEEMREILRVYDMANRHTPAVEAVRVQHPMQEPGGLMFADRVVWSAESGWHEGSHDAGYTLEERMALGDSGAVSFHCHPVKEGRDEFQTQASDGDCGATVMNRNEVVFAQGGRVLITSTVRYPFAETEEHMARLWEKAKEEEGRGNGDAPWIMLDFI